MQFCALGKYQDDTKGKKFLKLLTNKDNILKVFQKKLEHDSLTIVDIE